MLFTLIHLTMKETEMLSIDYLCRVSLIKLIDSLIKAIISINERS